MDRYIGLDARDFEDGLRKLTDRDLVRVLGGLDAVAAENAVVALERIVDIATGTSLCSVTVD